jgi:PAS domain S-box-containing protein
MDYTSTPDEELLKDVSVPEQGVGELERPGSQSPASGQIVGGDPALLTTFLENALDGVYMTDMKGALLYVNPRCEDITGYGKDELLGRSFAELRILSEEGLNNAIELLQEHVEGRPMRSVPVQLTNKAGRSVSVRMAANIIKGMDGNVILGSLRDMVGHEGADEALPESEQRFRDLSERALVGMYILQDGVFRYANAMLARILGCEPDEMDGKPVRDVIFPEDWPLVEKAMHRRISGELESLHYEFRTVRKDGEIRDTEVYSSRTVYGGRPAIIGTYLDITERKRTEAALRECEARWQFALEGAGDGVWDWDAVTDRVFFSARWKAMLGYAEDEIGDTLDEWDRRVHPDDKACVYANLEQHFSKKTEYYQSEHRLLCKDGTYKWILDRGKVIEWTSDGKPRRVIGTHTDITERRRAEEEKRHNERLTAALEMAGAICHELNQPLQVIGGRIDLLQMDHTDDRVQASLEVMKGQIDRMGTITRELMGLKKYSNRDYMGKSKITDIHQAPGGDGE